MLQLYKQKAFITIKDHKYKFENYPQYRLLNPTKNNIGKISENILERVCLYTSNAVWVNQWRNTKGDIYWFKGIKK